MIKSLILSTVTILLSTSAWAFTGEESIGQLLSAYDAADSGTCAIAYDAANHMFSIKGENGRKSVSLPVDQIDATAPVFTATYGNYDGTSEILFIKKTYTLLVIGMWNDNELGPDKSSYCEVLLKK